MAHRRNFECSDDSQGEYCVPGAGICGLNDCPDPFDNYNPVYVLSANPCDSSCEPYDEGYSQLCDEQTLSECPPVEHCEIVKKPKKPKCDKKGRCRECGYGKCKCEKRECDWFVVLCEDSDCEDGHDCSVTDDCCSVPIVPCAPCNVGLKEVFEEMARGDDSCAPCKKPLPPCEKEKKKCWKGCNTCGEEKCKCKKDHKKHDECKGCYYPKDKCRCKSSDSDKPKGRVIKISFGSKREHPWRHRIVDSEQAIYVDGVAGKSIHLTAGNSYLFEVEKSDSMDFFLTEDPIGGPRGKWADSPLFEAKPLQGSFEPAQGKMVMFRPDGRVNQLYYQSRQTGCQGGLVYVHGRK